VGNRARSRRWIVHATALLFFIGSEATQVTETPETAPQAEASIRKLDKQPAAPIKRSSRMPAILMSLAASVGIGAAAINAMPYFNVEPKFGGFAELFSRETASASIPDPIVTAALKDIQSAQQQHAAALRENGTVLQQTSATLQQDTATLEMLRQGFTSQKTNLQNVSNQLSRQIARVDSLQDAVAPLTTSSIPKPHTRARLVRTSRKKLSRPPTPLGPFSIGGAPLNPAPGWGPGSG
jgi:hypothetical protein